MTHLAPNSSTDSALVPSTSNPFLSVDPLEPSHNTVGALDTNTLGADAQMMPIIPELSGLRLDGQWNEQRSTAQAGRLGEHSPAVLQALANELAPIYPQLAKALTAPSLDSALQSGVGLFSRGSQLIEGTMDSGKVMASAKASDVGSSVRELVEGALTQWQAETNPLRNGLNQQTQSLVSDLKAIAAEVDDSTWMDTVKRRLAVARKQVEGVTDGVFTSLGYAGDAAIDKDEAAVEQATQRLQQTLVDFRNSSDFTPTLKTAFGDNGQTAEAEALVDDLIAGSKGPAIEIVDAQLLLGDGAFGNNTIFISDEVVAEAAENTDALDEVLLEEVGHYFDQALNTVDSAGDEGEIFAKLVQGEDLSNAEMLALKGENDHSTLTVNDTTINVENRYFVGGSANHAFTAPPITTPAPKPAAHPLTIPTPTTTTPTPVSGSDRKLYLQAGTVDKFDAAVKAQSQTPTSAPTPVSKPTPVFQPSEPASKPASELTGGSGTGNGTVEVKAGDTLSAIASQHGVQWTELRKPDGSAFTKIEARGLQIGANVVLPNQPAPTRAPTPTAEPVTVTSPIPTPVTPSTAAPASPAAIRQKVTQLQDDAEVLATASPYAAQAMQQEAQALIEEEEQHVAEAERIAAAEQRQDAKERREKIAQLTADAELLATASPYAAQAMNAEAQALIAETPAPDPQQLKKDAELLATASPYAAQAMNEQANELIAKAEKEKTQQLFDDAELLATASPYAAKVMQAEAEERAAEEQAVEAEANGDSLSKIEQLRKDAELLATASPYASQAMQAEAEVLIMAEEKRQTIQRLQSDAELLATASPYASQAMQAEAEALIAESQLPIDQLPKIEQLQQDAELLATANPYAAQAMQAEAEELIEEEERQRIQQLQEDAELLATASPYASQTMQAEVDEWLAEERRQEIIALNQVDGQGLEHRFMGTHPEAAELLGTGNYADNFLSGFELDLVAAEQAANDHNGNDNQAMLQSIFDPVVTDKRTIIDEYTPGGSNLN
ncbi:MAG: LysM peptidoglycan-binding domain-containing protein [Cyanobacteria bacterium P01_F01_bin.53]